MLERLEDRTLPSSFTAAGVSDLIAAINAANKAGGSNTITLAAPTTSPYVLTAVNNSTDGPTGLPVIKKGDSLTIVGNGDTIERSTAAGTPAFRLADVASGGVLTLQNLTLANGLAFGAGAAAEGAGVYNQGTLDLSAVTVQGNTAQGADGQIFTTTKALPPGQDGVGGGIWSNGSLTLENGTVLQGNSALGGAGGQNRVSYRYGLGAGGNGLGGGLDVAGGTATISGTTFSGNQAQGGLGGSTTGTYPAAGNASGGGVYVAGGQATFTAATLANNSARGGQGATGGGSGGNASGGGLYVANGHVALTSTTLTSNIAHGGTGGGPGGNASGGGLSVAGGQATLTAATLTNNIAQAGQGAPLGGGGAFLGGSASGGGLYMAGGTVSLSDSTVQGNVVAADREQAYGAGLDVAGGTLSLCSDVIEYNKTLAELGYPGVIVDYLIPGSGGGIFIAPGATVYLDPFTLSNTIDNIAYLYPNIEGTYLLRDC
jgi:hypothetical protein